MLNSDLIRRIYHMCGNLTDNRKWLFYLEDNDPSGIDGNCLTAVIFVLVSVVRRPISYTEVCHK